MGWLKRVWAALVALFTVAIHDGIPRLRVGETPTFPSEAVSAEALIHLPSSPLKALLDQMEKAFPAPSIKPGSDMASLQYAAGQRAVVDWVRMKQKRGQA